MDSLGPPKKITAEGRQVRKKSGNPQHNTLCKLMDTRRRPVGAAEESWTAAAGDSMPIWISARAGLLRPVGAVSSTAKTSNTKDDP